MANILACRVCLATGIKLLDIFEFRFHGQFETLTETQVLKDDHLPHYICDYCGSVLLKSVFFQKQLRSCEDHLLSSISKGQELTPDFLRSVRLDLCLPLRCDTITRMLTSLARGETLDETNMCAIEKQIKFDLTVELYVDDEGELYIQDPGRHRNMEEDDLYDDENSDVEAATRNKDQDNNGDTDKENNELADVEVVILTKEQQKKEIKKKKTSYNYLNSSYKCKQCYKGFIHYVLYKNHMRRHNLNSGPFVCDICLVRWRRARHLRAHVAACHERKYLCKLCDYTTRSSRNAKDHRKWHSIFKRPCVSSSAPCTSTYQPVGAPTTQPLPKGV